MKKLSSLLLALAGSLACSGANSVPSHIVQPLPRELDPRLEQPLTPPSHIVRPLTEEETARRERELAPVPTAGLKEDGDEYIPDVRAGLQREYAKRKGERTGLRLGYSTRLFMILIILLLAAFYLVAYKLEVIMKFF